MDRTRIGWALAALGAVLVVVSALADSLGLGEGGGFGWKQTVGVVVGAVLALVGGAVARRRHGAESSSRLEG